MSSEHRASPKDSPGSAFYAVIPAGGSGTRLWPLSRSGEPKFLLDLLGTGRSLLVETISRLEAFAALERVIIVTGVAHAEAVRKQVDNLPAANLLLEPTPKNSAAAVGLAAYVLAESDPDAIVGFFAADHAVSDDTEFQKVLEKAMRAAESGLLVTLGITPTEPSSAFGYIKKDRQFDAVDGVHHVTEFVEKPSFVDAQKFVASGEYFWNAGIFVGRVSSVVDAFDRFAPQLGTPLRVIAAQLIAGEDFSEAWNALPAEAFDYAVAEPAAADGRFLVVPGAFGWVDVGNFDTLAQAQGSTSPADVVVVGDQTKVHPNQSTGVVVTTSGRVITLLGVSDIVVVDTPDALLVTTREHAQGVKGVVDHLREQGLDDVL